MLRSAYPTIRHTNTQTVLAISGFVIAIAAWIFLLWGVYRPAAIMFIVGLVITFVVLGRIELEKAKVAEPKPPVA